MACVRFCDVVRRKSRDVNKHILKGIPLLVGLTSVTLIYHYSDIIFKTLFTLVHYLLFLLFLFYDNMFTKKEIP